MGNTIGELFKVTTFGESHGKAVGVVIDGVVPGIEITQKEIQQELDRRRPGQSKASTPRQEKDKAEILSGVFEGRTTGTSICMIIKNHDAHSKSYEDIKDIFRPGHADYTYFNKYGIRDYRGGGRSSGRETIGRVAAGALAKKILSQYGIQVIAYTIEIAGVRAKKIDLLEIENNSVRCPDKSAAQKMEKKIISARKEGDSVGGIIEVVAKNVPVGLGDPVFDKLDADIAKAIMSIGAVKGVEIGAGFEVAKMKGSTNNDQMKAGAFISNNSGGILGGISNGNDIVVRAAIKPTPSILKPQKTIDIHGNEVVISVKGRHDPCICPRAVPVVEAMMAITLLDHLQRQKAIEAQG